MTRFHRGKGVFVLLLPLMLFGKAWAGSANPGLLALVPPGAGIVAGIAAPPSPDRPDNFILITHSNVVDLEDFFALTGADDSRTIREMIFVAMADDSGGLGGHSLLVNGHFNQQRLFKSATDGGAKATTYHGVAVLEIQPFARERGVFRDIRWFAVLDSGVVVFGTVAAARLELDRYLAHSGTDASLLHELAQLHGKDQTWCVLSTSIPALASPALNEEIRNELAMLNPDLAELSQSGGALEFGVHYGRQVEFEYAVAPASITAVHKGAGAATRSSSGLPWSSSLFPALDLNEDANTLHGVVKVSMRRYKKWLAEVRRTPIAVD
jgi:hypothetical protein